MHLIYKVTNKLNGKIYIGQKSYVGEPSMENYYGGGVEIKRAVKKYGRENFDREILYSRIRDQATADSMEMWTIEKYDSTNPKIGYNISKGGKVSEITTDTRNKISTSLKKYFAENGCSNKGKKQTDEQKRKKSEAQKKRFSNMEERVKTSIATKEAMSNEDVRKRLSSSLKEFYKRTGYKPNTNNGKKWYNNGEKSGFFIEGEQPEGWVKGRIYKRR